ncbi:MAG: hypothetical protein FWD18_00320 [Micrococcales bacterium]|nr:hypothetical protein [Micrococcales bacterium]
MLDFVRQGSAVYVGAEPATRRGYNQFVYESILVDADDGRLNVSGTKTEAFAALDALAEEVVGSVPSAGVREVGSAACGDRETSPTDGVSGVSVSGGGAAVLAVDLVGGDVDGRRDRMDHQLRRPRPART